MKSKYSSETNAIDNGQIMEQNNQKTMRDFQPMNSFIHFHNINDNHNKRLIRIHGLLRRNFSIYFFFFS